MNNKKLLSVLLVCIFLVFSLSTVQNTTVILYEPKDRPVVLIDLGHTMYQSDYLKIQEILPSWGFDVVISETATWQSGIFAGVDILLLPALSYNLTNSELQDVKTWFDSGEKSIWIAGDSDFGSNAGWSYRANELLSTIGSTIYVESGAIESDINFNIAYRVSASVYNTDDPNARFITSQLPYQGSEAMAYFHGPTAVIAKNNTGYFDLENNQFSKVEWVIKTTNATFVPSTSPSDAVGAQVHTSNQQGDFVLMALQYGAGLTQNSKIVVSGEAPFSTYRRMFDDPGDAAIPQNDIYIVYNTFMWFNQQGYLNDVAELPMVMIDYAHAIWNFEYDKFADHLLSWGYNVTKFMNGNFTANDFTGVDVLIVPALQYSYSTTELTILKNWFDSGNKAIWIAGDSDYAGEYRWTTRGNGLLDALGSTIYLESGSVESDINYGQVYRVGASIYNYNGNQAWDLVNGLPYQNEFAMALFHGPTAVIAKNATGYQTLEQNNFPNVEWVVKATNATFITNTLASDANGAQVHSYGQLGDFVLMALQTNAGASGTSKIAVSGEAPFSTYQQMFEDPSKLNMPNNDYYLVYNTIQWMVTRKINVRPVVLIDNSFPVYKTEYDDLISSLQQWGYKTILNEGNLTSTSLVGVDIVYVGQRLVNYTPTELGYLKSWFDQGDKGLWLTGDSDYSSTPVPALVANNALDTVGSSIFVEVGALESDINFGSTYQVSATDYNTAGNQSRYITSRLPLTGSDAMALFHGPTAVIGKDSGGNFIDLENNNLKNVEWAIKADNATFLPFTTVQQALGAQVHTYGQQENFVVMALQTNAGAAGTSKIVVTGESLGRIYKNMFSPIGEFGIPHNDYYIVYNTFQWMATIHTRPVNPVVRLLDFGEPNIAVGPVSLAWSVPEFHAPSFTFEIYVNNSVWLTTVDNQALLDLPTGYFEIYVLEKSLQGFVGRSLLRTVTVDVDDPVVTILSPTDGSTFEQGLVDLSWEASDIGQGINHFEILVDSISIATMADPPLTFTLSTLTPGTHLITVKAYDQLGNTGNSSITLNIIESTTSTTTTTGTTSTSSISSTSSSASTSPSSDTTLTSSAHSITTASPGFELLLLLTTVCIFYLYKRIRKQ